MLTCSTRLLNSETTLTDSGTEVVAVAAVVDSTALAGVDATIGAGAAATGAGTATGAGAAAAVVEAVVEVALRPFLATVVAEVEEAEVDILYQEPRNFFREINAGMLIKLTEKERFIFLLREREKATVFCAFDFFQMVLEPKE